MPAPTINISAAFAATGNEILVNTATEDFQYNPQIATLSNGGFVITWQDNSAGVGGAGGDTSGSSVKAQLFSSNGSAFGGEFLVNTATQNNQSIPKIAALSNGGFVVTWTDASLGVGGASGDTSGPAIKAQVFAANGTAVGSELRVNTATTNIQESPQITALSNGGFVITWKDSSAGVGGAGGDTSNTAIKAQVFAANGTAVGSELLVNTATAGSQVTPDITALSNGGFVVTWTDSSAGVGGAGGDTSSTAVKAQVFAANGTAIGSELLVNTNTVFNQYEQNITALSNGGFAVTWTDGSGQYPGVTGDTSLTGIKAQVFAANGTAVGSEILVNTATQSIQQSAQITGLSNGGFVVTWKDYSAGVGGAGGDTSGTAIKAQVFAANGTAVGSELRVNTATASDQFEQNVTALPNGGFVITWRDSSAGVGGAEGDTSDSAVKAQVFAANGTAVGSEILVNTATSSYQTSPQITALSNGGFVITWQDDSRSVGGAVGDTSYLAIKAQVFSPVLAAVEQVPLSLKNSGIDIADADAADIQTVTLSTTYGVLSATAGTSGASVAGTGTSTLTITGTAAQVSALLNSDSSSTIAFNANTDAPPASTVLTISANDSSTTVTSTLNIAITAVADAPAATGLPTDVTVDQNVASNLNLSAVTLSDPDTSGTITVVLTASAGTIAATTGGSVSITNSGTAALTLSGTASDIDAYLNTASNIQYTGPSNVSGNNAATLTVTANDGSGAVTLGTVNIDITPPDTTRPTATIAVADTALSVGETSGVTITFSEAVTGFTNADLTIDNGTLTNVASSDGGITWTATLTPTAAITDATNLITLNNTGVADAAGNAGTGTTTSGNYAIDTTRPTATIAVADTALSVGETSGVTITFSEAVTGFTNADLTIDNGTLTNVASSDGGITWTATLTPTAAITDATNLITLNNTGVADAAGNAGTGTTTSGNYAIDTTRPTATIAVADTALTVGETSGVTITFSEAVTGFTNADLTIDNGTLTNVASSDGGITWR
ncbi:Ig-like domain-containing protein, partial [Caulobacter henricii]|uniref:Ig-like domain-containing protein n=1 Tax=Caulobacter henricii TaxID=69395 RepID=UPI00360B6323